VEGLAYDALHDRASWQHEYPDPLETVVTTPTGGLISIRETAPAATPADPLILAFTFDASIVRPARIKTR